MFRPRSFVRIVTLGATLVALAVPMVITGSASAAPTASQLSAAKTRLVANKDLTVKHANDTKAYAIYYAAPQAQASKTASERYKNNTLIALADYKKLLISAGKWSGTTKKFAEDQFNIALFYDAGATNEFKSMSFDIYVAVVTANNGFRAQGKSTTHASATALDVLRAIRWHNASPKDWAFNQKLYQRIALESSGDRFAQNGSSSAYGRFQFLNQTWAGVGNGCYKTSDGVIQSKCGLIYIAQRFGHPNNLPSSGSY